jgi:serine/threonine protein kinase
MHSLGVIHGDLQGQNILIDNEDCAKICDFELGELKCGDDNVLYCQDKQSLGRLLEQMILGFDVDHPGKEKILDNTSDEVKDLMNLLKQDTDRTRLEAGAIFGHPWF